MKITRAAEYAIRCIYFLANEDVGATVNKNKLSRIMGIPEQFLSKIAQQLARNGIISVIQGSKGGLKLLKDPEKITLLEVVETVMGKILLNECIQDNSIHGVEYCKRKRSCSIHLVWAKAQQDLRTTLRTANFKNLIEDGVCFDES